MDNDRRELTDTDWNRNNRAIRDKIAGQLDSLVRSNLCSLVIALNCVATNHDGDVEMDQETNMKAARTLLHDLDYPLVDE